MLKTKRAAFASLTLAILFGVLLGMYWTRLFNPLPGPKILDTPMLLLQVKTLSQLVTVQYIMEKAVVWEDPPQTILGQFFSGDNRLLILANGVVKAGVDLGQIQPEDVVVEGKKLSIKLPPALITDAYLDDKQTQVIERSTGFLRSFDKDLEQTVRRTAVADIRAAAGRNGILTEAEERARKQLAALFLQLGFEEVEFRYPARANGIKLRLKPAETSPAPKP